MKVTILETTEKIPESIRLRLVSDNITINTVPSLEAYHGSYDYLAEYSNEMSEAYFRILAARALDRPALIGETERLIVKEIGIEDINAYYALLTECPEYAVDNRLQRLTFSEFVQFHEAYISNQYCLFGYGIWGLYLKSGILIGFCGINSDNHQLAYCITKSQRRQGFAYEACRFVINHLKTEYEIDDISLEADAQNTASIHLAQRLNLNYKIIN